ncbi:unnamed protein product [Soboliphyme baturini]|uniref:Anoctamin n=1 Tax=Soboliphyme baturini TaxID=241478 RepID=A0A3P8A1Y3_9BILA|nr:unnamed protein product [Soboliphyme baturini]
MFYRNVIYIFFSGRRFGRSEVSPDDARLATRSLPQWQKDFLLNEPDLDGVYAEYLEMMVQFGYATLFVSLFPLSPLICFLNNIVEIRLDAINFTASYRRSIPLRVSGIEIWHYCLDIILKLAIMSNAATLAFTSESIPRFMYLYFSKYKRKSYVQFTLIPFNTTLWTGYHDYFPNTSQVCYYKDTYQSTIEWREITIVRLSVFIVFVLFFFIAQLVCKFFLSKPPEHITDRINKAKFLARQAMFANDGEEESKSRNKATGSLEEIELRETMGNTQPPKTNFVHTVLNTTSLETSVV